MTKTYLDILREKSDAINREIDNIPRTYVSRVSDDRRDNDAPKFILKRRKRSSRAAKEKHRTSEET